MNTFKELKNLPSVKAQINFTLSYNNMQSFKDAFVSIKEAYPDIRLDDINVTLFQKSSFYFENENLMEIDKHLMSEEITRILRMDCERLSLNNFLRKTYLRLYLRYIKNKRYPLKCQALASTCFLDPYGNIFPCSVYNRKLLNVREMNNNFDYLWNTKDAKRLYYECATYLCPVCWSPCDAYSAIVGSLVKALFL